MKDFGLGLEQAAYMVREDAAQQAERDRRHAALLDALARVVRVFSPIEAANILHTDEREALNEARQALKEAGEL